MNRLFDSIVCYTRGNVGKEYTEDLLSRVSMATESPSKIIKEISNSCEIKRTLKVNINPWGDLCLHEYRWNPKRVLLSPFRLSRGEKIWRFYDDIIKSRVSVPEPVLFIEIKKYLFTTKTYIATKWISDGFDLSRLALRRSVPYAYDLDSIFFKCVVSIANLHNGGFTHGDLKWSNLLFIHNQSPDVMLIDLDSLKRTASTRMQIRDFARFLIPPGGYVLEQEAIEGLTEKYIENRRISRSSVERIVRNYLAKRKR